jgi:hypothetical protein
MNFVIHNGSDSMDNTEMEGTKSMKQTNRCMRRKWQCGKGRRSRSYF